MHKCWSTTPQKTSWHPVKRTTSKQNLKNLLWNKTGTHIINNLITQDNSGCTTTCLHELSAYINHSNLCVKVYSLTIDRTVLQSKPEQQCKLLQLASEMGYMKTEVISKGEIFFLPLSLVPKALLKQQSFICWLHKWLNKSTKWI